MNLNASFEFNLESDNLLDSLIHSESDNEFQLGIDYGNGDIQKVGLFKLLPSRVNTFKRKRKGKRFIIYKYNIDNLICFNGGIENGSNIQNKTI